MVSPGTELRPSTVTSIEDCLRASLACQLACIALVDAGLKRAGIKPTSAVMRACLSCLDACMLLGATSVLNRASAKELVPYLLNCIDACATCEAECREVDGGDLLAQHCEAACRRLREQCGQLIPPHAPARDLRSAAHTD